MVVQHVGCDRVALALVRDHEQRRAVDEDAGAAEQREHDEADAVEDGIDVEVVAEAAAHSGDHAVGSAPAELSVCRVFGHGATLPPASTGVDPEIPWFDPTIALRWPRS